MSPDLHDAACVTCLLRRGLGTDADLDWAELPAAPGCPFRSRPAARVAFLPARAAAGGPAQDRAAS